MILLKKIRSELRALADPVRAKTIKSFFKTGPGEYGYDDQFLGITVPKQRALAKTYYESIDFTDLKSLLSSSFLYPNPSNQVKQT